MQSLVPRFIRFVTIVLIATVALNSLSLAQSRPQRPEPSKGEGGKRNARPLPKTEEELKKEEEERKRQEEEKTSTEEPGVVSVDTNTVSIDAVVFNKKSGQIITGLKKENFAIFENGVKQNISSFTTPDAPITVTVVLEYSKWTEAFGRANTGSFEPGVYEAVRPVAEFLGRFIRPPDDYASVIAFDLRPTPITDFTNDPNRLRQTVDLLFRNSPAFRENNLYDSLKFALVGGLADSVVLEQSKTRKSQYGGMVDVKAKRRAILLVASGLNTFSSISFSDVRKIAQEAGIPIYIISTANLFCKMYCDYLDPMRVMVGTPDRLDFISATNQMNTLAKETGGAHFPMTFPGETGGYLNTINAHLRSQYNLAYDLDQPHEPGKKYKLEVKVDVDGDGVYEDKTFVVQHRPFIMVPKPKDSPKLKS
ncbi:MAG TPA: VWA domain-containing protein [Pyrinomonadaceae bacterium]|nr:VWA domain-containing protein [Pyrinomonadaceae bacterium]